MRLVLEQDPQILTVRSYRPGAIEVGGERLHAPFIISAERLVRDWAVRTPAELDLAALQPLLELLPQVILIGASGGFAAPPPWREQVHARNVALEFMELGAACRTYNVLAQERRAVVAGLFP
jgi:uncharacterized protein